MKWQKLSSKPQKVGYKTVVLKNFKLPDGSEAEYTTWYKENMRMVATIALTPEGEVITAYQFRPGPEEMLYELPGGFLDEDEEPEVAALRELKEETGYLPDKPLKYLGIGCHDGYANSTWKTLKI